MKTKLFVSGLTLLLIVVIFFLGEDYVRAYGFWVYLIQFAFILVLLFRSRNNYVLLLSPSFLALMYLSLSYFFGQYVIYNNISSAFIFHHAFVNYESVTFITIYFLLCNLIVLLSLPIKSIKKINFLVKAERNRKDKKFFLLFLFLMLGIFSFVKIDFSFFGGGSYSYAFKLAITIFIVYIVRSKKLRVRLFIYIPLVLFFIAGSYDSKREIFFVIILICFFELFNRRKDLKFNLRNVFIGTAGAALFFYIILVSSIMRGYGNFGVENPIEATKYISTYLRSDYIDEALTANFELTPAYGNTSNAVNYVYSGQVDLLYGSTFLKVFFLPVPRRIFPGKPDSMIDIYTWKFAPTFRARGGSYPVGIYGEAYWNFGFFALFFIFFLFYFINKAFVYLIKSLFLKGKISTCLIFALFMYITFITFVRGSGLDLWLVYALVSLPLIFAISELYRYNYN